MKRKIDVKKIISEYEKYLESFNWNSSGTLTTPYYISYNAITNAVNRMEKFLDKEDINYRLYSVIEPFDEKGYHLHFTAWIDGYNSTQTIQKIEKVWHKVVGVKKRTNNKCRKYDPKCINYILKFILTNRTSYSFGGNAWKKN
jgi:hypothetical protein